MVRIAPVRLTFNPKTLWFDAQNLELASGDEVVVGTARGSEFGSLCGPVFEMTEEDGLSEKLKSPLKPVKRLATDEDRARSDEMARLSAEALPLFKQLAAETNPDMNPVAVEYLFEGDKAVFYFESEERIDFRDLVRKLASEFHVRVDMKQIGTRDSARMVGGIGHCGQELCCRRLGGEFNPVSIRMAKEQDLSLNPGKISGLCGRLMCCLRYEYDAYKDFHTRAPKKNAKIDTPDGEGKVVDLDVPREIVSITVGDEKPVKVPLADMEPVEEGVRPNAVGEEAWEAANAPSPLMMDAALTLFSDRLSGEDQLAKPGQVRHVHEAEEKKPSRRSRRSRGESRSEAPKAEQASVRKPRRRRSTTVSAEGETSVQQPIRKKQAQKHEAEAQKPAESRSKSSSRRRNRSRSGAKAQDKPANEQKRTVQVGRNSSALRAGRSEGQESPSGGEGKKQQQEERRQGQDSRRRRRRSHPSSSSSSSKQE